MKTNKRHSSCQKHKHAAEKDGGTAIVVLTPFRSKSETENYIYNEWKSGMLHECVKDYPYNEVSWETRYLPEYRGYGIMLIFQHADAALKYERWRMKALG